MPMDAQIEAVATDEELEVIFATAYFNTANKNGLHHLNELEKVSLWAGIRAVRERLAVPVPDVVIPELPWWVGKVIFIAQGEHWDCLLVRWISTTESRSIVGRGPMPADALSAALAEAGKDPSDG